jgi:hypothetical protein
MLCSKINNIRDIQGHSWKRYVHQIGADGKILYSHGPITDDGLGLAPGLLTDEETIDLFNTYNQRFLDILAELAPEKVKLYKSSGISVILSGKDKKYMAHTDVDSKILSTVIYLAPEKNRGTLIAENKQMDNAQEIEWKQNRAFIFSAQKNITWHSYGADGVNPRLVLVWYMQKVLKDQMPTPRQTGTFVEQKKKGIILQDDY